MLRKNFLFNFSFSLAGAAALFFCENKIYAQVQTVLQTAVQTQNTADSGSVSLGELEQTALVNHPTIQAYEQKICSLNGYWQQAGLAPNPEIGYNAEEMSSATPGGRQGVTVSQEIVRGGQRYFAQEVVVQQIQAAKQELEMAKLRVLTDVRSAAYEYLSVQNKLLHLREISANDAKIAQRIAESSEKGYGSKLDVINARISARKSQQQYAKARTELDAAWKRLACLLGTPDMKPRLVKASLEELPTAKSQDAYAQMLLASSPELARAQALICQAQKKMEYENSRNTSNVTVSGGMTYNTEEDVIEGNVGISMPLRVRDRNQGNIAAARSEVIQAQREYDRVALAVQHRLAEVYARYTEARENIELYQTSLLPDAQNALKLAQDSYEKQGLSLLELVTAQRTYRETYIEYYDVLCDYWTAYTILEGNLLSGALEDSSL